MHALSGSDQSFKTDFAIKEHTKLIELYKLAGLVCTVFNKASTQANSLEKVKNNNKRDIVTSIDLKLNEIALDFSKKFEDLSFYSEESNSNDFLNQISLSKSIFLVDPLDGSNNLMRGCLDFSFQACIINKGKITHCLIVQPKYGVFIIGSPGRLYLSRPLSINKEVNYAPVYFAYPPRIKQEFHSIKIKLQEDIDNYSSGLCRTGSCSVAMFELCLGKYKAVVGLEVRLWDCIPMFNFISHMKSKVYYFTDGLFVTFVAGNDLYIEPYIKTTNKNIKGNLHKFNVNSRLELL